MEVEVWKDVPDYEELYQVSNLGKVRSLDRLVKGAKGLDYRIKGKTTKEAKNYLGYIKVRLHKEGIRKEYSLHRIVAISFVLNIELKKEVNHIDGNKLNNAASNLEWCTRSENMKHAFRTGLVSNKGEDGPSRKLSNEDVLLIRASNDGCVKLSKRFNVSPTSISSIKRRRSWNHI